MNEHAWLFPVFVFGIGIGIEIGWLGAIESVKRGIRNLVKAMNP